MKLTYNLLYTLSLHHYGELALLACLSDGRVLVEEFYEGAWVAQHWVLADGQLAATADEHYGQADFQALRIPQGATLATKPPSLDSLTFDTAAPQRGIREQDHIDALVLPLEVAERFALVQQLGLRIAPPMLLGVSRSRILSGCPLPNGAWLICRRLDLAYLLAQPSAHANYDTHTVHLLQTIDDLDAPPPLLNLTRTLETPTAPVSCLCTNDRLYIGNADGEHINQLFAYALGTS